MVLIVEDGSVVAGAESYASVADTDAYNTDYVGDTTWDAGTTEARKEIALRRATQYLDSVYYSQWRGERVDEDQPLQWPRKNAEYDDGICIPDDEIPIELKRACMELAIVEVTDNGLFVDVAAQNQGLKELSQKAAVVSQTKKWAGTAPTQKQYTIVETLVQPLIYGAGSTERG